MRVSAVTSLAVLMTTSIAFGQERGLVLSPQAAADRQTAELKRSAELAARVPFESPVKGAPYSADIIVESSQTLADGNRISNKHTGRVYRDSEGRTRREQEGTISVVTRTEPVVSTRRMTISIVDPVAGYTYSLNPEQKIAYRTPLATSKELLDKVQLGVAAAQRSSQPQAQLTPEQKAATGDDLAKVKADVERQIAAANAAKEGKANIVVGREGGWVGMAYTADNTPLEHATIDGLAVEGHKRSETIPAGQVGNEQPIVITSEEWTSTDLKVLVLTKHNDPRTGESSYRLTNVVRAEPDPSLFMVPPDYTVKDTGIRRNNE